MSDGTINEVSMKLGQLLSDAEEQKRVRERLFEKLDVTTERLTEAIGILKHHIDEDKKVEARVVVVEKQIVEEIIPHVKAMTEIKTRGLWILGVLAAIGGSAGTGVAQAIKKITGLDP